MKSYFLEGLASSQAAHAILSEMLPSQSDPWVLLASEGDVIAYFNVVDVNQMAEEADERDGPFAIVVDVSGRHYGDDQRALSVLRQLRSRLSGKIKDDIDNVL